MLEWRDVEILRKFFWIMTTTQLSTEKLYL